MSQQLTKQDQVQTLINVLNAMDILKIEGAMSHLHAQIKDGVAAVLRSINDELNQEKSTNPVQ